ncbi:hypothetical protein [Phytomonospora endophytica]|uniref:Uncharacterized protein n=1 Tax=Phytomonospora endophytica TaxID=714109 RepID=A0A841FKB7_9ACTN|nr:hypothetical protein [Phytomonospora endophytica]MBB6036606.1 hypothetical protein [Phytomonospora endophytica]GIG65927.1 hypothetical protein Pen01_22220 [Phytomonospora endophytica]
MKKHQTDTVSLVFAVIFLGVVGWWLAARFTELTPAGFGLMVAGTLIAAGLIGLVSALRPRKPAPAAGPAPTPGLFESGASTTVDDDPPSFGGLDLNRLSEEDRARADELIRKMSEARAQTVVEDEPGASSTVDPTARIPRVTEEPTVEIPRDESPVTRPEWPEEPDTPDETGDRKSGG